MFEEWDGTFWDGYGPFESTNGPVSWERVLERARTAAGTDHVWPTLAADTRTSAEQRIWQRAARLVEGCIDSPSMAVLATRLRRPDGHKRMAAVVESRFRVPAAILATTDGA